MVKETGNCVGKKNFDLLCEKYVLVNRGPHLEQKWEATGYRIMPTGKKEEG